MEKYDSRPATKSHIKRIKEILLDVQLSLAERGKNHDASKLIDPEKSAFDEMTPELKKSVYGSQEYSDRLKKLAPALEHHYKCNYHHPEHYENGIDGMNLLDIVEMFCDWKAASERHEIGSIKNSLETNRKRFNISDQLYAILENTAKEFGWME